MSLCAATSRTPTCACRCSRQCAKRPCARLAAEGKLDDLRRRHAGRFLELAVTAETELTGTAQADWLIVSSASSTTSARRLICAFRQDGSKMLYGLCPALERFWRARGHLTEVRGLLSQGLATADGVSSAVRARALWTAGHAAMDPIRLSRCGPGVRRGAGHLRELDDDRHAVFALCELARALSSQEEFDRAQRVGRKPLRCPRRPATTERLPPRSTRSP